jgi:hypothetical protein
LAKGKVINLANNANSTPINTQNKTVLAVGLSHRKYSINNVAIKYNKPIAKNKIAPLTSSLV